MLSQVLAVCAVVAAVRAGALLHAGSSVSSRHQDALGNYAFGYDIVDGKGASNSRSEVGDKLGNKQGSYTLHDVDGRARRVDYVADAHGFRATVKTNEPGTAASAPAAALIASPYAAPVAVKHLAPAYAHAAPVYAHAAPAYAHVAPAYAHAAPAYAPAGYGYAHAAPAYGAYGHGAYYGHDGYGHLGYGSAKAYHY